MIESNTIFKDKQPLPSKNGFTLVELLVVVSLTGILAGVMISIINPVKQRKIAQDGVKMANLQKLALGIEAFGNANSKYPASLADPDLPNFVARVPDGEPAGAVYSYFSTAGDNFAVVVTKSEDTASCFKYRAAWGKIKTCPVSTSCGAEITEAGCQ